jgi:hypothetical protein
MRKALSSILTPLLLLAGTFFAAGQSKAPSGHPRLGPVESPAVPAARPADPLVRSLAGLKTRSLHDGPGAGPAAAPAVSSAFLTIDLLFLRLDPPSHPAPVTGSARQLPAFPTGPPSHS